MARAARISQSQLARIELGRNRMVSVEVVTIVASFVGLDLVCATYPGQRVLRDEPQTMLLQAFRDFLGEAWWWRYEVQVGSGDQRAWDARVRHRRTGVEFVIEAETRLHDVQALLRRIALKRGDASVRVILLVAATRNNRLVLDIARDAFHAEFPTDTRACLAALSKGRDPGSDAVVILEPRARRERTGIARRDPATG